MKQIKLIHGMKLDDLETKVNQWLLDHVHLKVTNIQVTVHPTYRVVMIEYVTEVSTMQIAKSMIKDKK